MQDSQNSMVYKNDFMRGAASLVALIVLMLTTNPQRVSLALLLAAPVLIFILAFSLARPALSFFMRLGKVRAKNLSAFLASGPTLLFLLATLGQLGMQDILLATLFVAGFFWYYYRLQGSRNYS